MFEFLSRSAHNELLLVSARTKLRDKEQQTANRKQENHEEVEARKFLCEATSLENLKFQVGAQNRHTCGSWIEGAGRVAAPQRPDGRTFPDTCGRACLVTDIGQRPSFPWIILCPAMVRRRCECFRLAFCHWCSRVWSAFPWRPNFPAASASHSRRPQRLTSDQRLPLKRERPVVGDVGLVRSTRFLHSLASAARSKRVKHVDIIHFFF